MIIERIRHGEDPALEPVEPELTHSALAERFMRVHAGAHDKPDTAALPVRCAPSRAKSLHASRKTGPEKKKPDRRPWVAHLLFAE